jgi:DEAD/DEAH box helicase domain-containing protein
MKRLSPSTQQGSIPEYLQALKTSSKYGPQVVCHKSFPGENARVPSSSPELSQKLRSCLHHFGISALYEHQARALELVREGKDLLTATPTASGKSMIYNLPMLETILTDNEARGLYLFPLKALAQDQFRVLSRFEDLLAMEKMVPQVPLAALYDGDTSAWQRKKIRANLPHILITNPDMLHLSFLPYHATWRNFFQQLRYIVIDEVHTYRGVFGSHMAWVLRRLQRILDFYGARPTFILLSATIGNPEELGQMLIGRPVVSITRSGAPRAKRHMLFLNPWDSAAHTAS